MTLLERLGRREEKGKAEVKEENIFAGRAVDAKEEEYQTLKLNVQPCHCRGNDFGTAEDSGRHEPQPPGH